MIELRKAIAPTERREKIFLDGEEIGTLDKLSGGEYCAHLSIGRMKACAWSAMCAVGSTKDEAISKAIANGRDQVKSMTMALEWLEGKI